jgi:hypothetical protein
MLNGPDAEHTVPPAGKLLLPAPPDEELRASRGQIHPGQLIRQKMTPAPKGALAKLVYYWRKDPAYKVFMIAMVMVALAGILLASLAGNALLGKSFLGNSFPQNPAAGVVPGSTVDLRPSFPTPGGGNGSGKSSQPPVQSTPTLKSTPTSGPSPTAPPSPTASPGPGGALTVQITSYSSIVLNGSRTNVTVTTNQPGVTVWLQIRYNVQPFKASAGPQTTDANGNATLSWLVAVSSFGHRSAQATVIAVAMDQNGQSVFSSPVTIQIVSFGVG